MNEDKILDKTWIVDMVTQHCSHIKEQMNEQGIIKENYGYVDSVRRRVDVGFCLSDDDSCPMSYIKGTMSGDEWSAKACQCTTIICNEQGYLELKYPESSSVRYTYCNFSYSNLDYGVQRYQKIKISICDVDVTYPSLPECCTELPKAISSESGAKLEATFTIVAESGELAFIQYEHYGYPYQVTSEWYWVNPSYDAKTLVTQAEKEYGRFSLEAARAHERLYAQERVCRDKYVVEMTSNHITHIYLNIYGDTSNEPALINAIKRDFDSIVCDNYCYYGHTLDCYRRMLRIKEVHPEVDFPDVEELRKLIEKLEPLAKEEAWERYTR